MTEFSKLQDPTYNVAIIQCWSQMDGFVLRFFCEGPIMLCDTASAPRGRDVFKKPVHVSCIEETGYLSCSLNFQDFLVAKSRLSSFDFWKYFQSVKRSNVDIIDIDSVSLTSCDLHKYYYPSFKKRGIFVNRNTFQKWMSVLSIEKMDEWCEQRYFTCNFMAFYLLMEMWHLNIAIWACLKASTELLHVQLTQVNW